MHDKNNYNNNEGNVRKNKIMKYIQEKCIYNI